MALPNVAELVSEREQAERHWLNWAEQFMVLRDIDGALDVLARASYELSQADARIAQARRQYERMGVRWEGADDGRAAD